MFTYFKKNFFLSCFILFSSLNFYFVCYSGILKNSKFLTDIMPKILNYSLKMQAPALKNISLNKNNNNSLNGFSPNNFNFLQNMNIGESFKNILVEDKNEELPEELKKEREEILKELKGENIINDSGFNITLVRDRLGLEKIKEETKIVQDAAKNVFSNISNIGNNILESNSEFNLINEDLVGFKLNDLKKAKEVISDKIIKLEDLKNSDIFGKFNMDNSPFAQMIKFNFLKSNAENSLKELSENFKSKNNLVDESLKLLSENGYKKFIEIIESKTKELNDLKNKNQELNNKNKDNKFKKDQLEKEFKRQEGNESELNKNNEELDLNISENNKKLENQKVENENKIRNLDHKIQEKEEIVKNSENIEGVQEVLELSNQMKAKVEEINLLKQKNEELKLESDKILKESTEYLNENTELEKSLKDSGDAKNQENNILRMQEELNKAIQDINDKKSQIDLLSQSEKEEKEKVESIIKKLEENKIKIESLEKEIKQLEEDKTKLEENEKVKNKENQDLAVGKLTIQESLIEKINKYSLFLNEYNSIIENIKEIYNLISDLISQFKDLGLSDLENIIKEKKQLIEKSLLDSKKEVKN